MTSPKPIWMAMYWDDYARDTAHFSVSHHGAYLMLIKHYWCTGTPLPDDDAQLARLAICDGVAHWRKLKPLIEPMFVVGDGMWRHKRIDQELAKAAELITSKSKAGKEGARRRWQKQ